MRGYWRGVALSFVVGLVSMESVFADGGLSAKVSTLGLGADLRSVCVAFKPASIVIPSNVRRFARGVIKRKCRIGA